MRFTIKTKLGLSFGAVLLLSAAAGAFGIRSLQSTNEVLEDFAERPFQQVQAIEVMQTELQSARRSVLRAMFTADPAELAPLRQGYDEAWAESDRQLQRFLGAVQSASGKAEVADLAPLMQATKTVTDQAFELAAKADANLARNALARTQAPFDALSVAIDKMRADPALAQAADPMAARIAADALTQAVQASRLSMLTAISQAEDRAIQQASDGVTASDAQVRSALNDLGAAAPSLRQAANQIGSLWSAYYPALRAWSAP